MASNAENVSILWRLHNVAEVQRLTVTRPSSYQLDSVYLTIWLCRGQIQNQLQLFRGKTGILKHDEYDDRKRFGDRAPLDDTTKPLL